LEKGKGVRLYLSFIRKNLSTGRKEGPTVSSVIAFEASFEAPIGIIPRMIEHEKQRNKPPSLPPNRR